MGDFFKEIMFEDSIHKEEFTNMIFEMNRLGRCLDGEHISMAYLSTLGCMRGRGIYNVKTDSISLTSLEGGWQSSGTTKATLLAFNLWNGYVDMDNALECTPVELFCCSLAPYFMQAIRLRYRDYFNDI